jgi:hypothetical protein
MQGYTKALNKYNKDLEYYNSKKEKLENLK